MSSPINYLALGDSYTVGEGIALVDSFPYQTVQLIRKNGLQCHAPELIAKTGWTTSELASQVDHSILLSRYSIVSLLIGVNNQYRVLSSADYAVEFEELLTRSVSLAGHLPERVFVLSIPDWGLTTFATNRNHAKISAEIRHFNQINRNISDKYKVEYIDVTTGSPETRSHPEFLAPDGLHPSAKAYQRWAEKLAYSVTSKLARDT